MLELILVRNTCYAPKEMFLGGNHQFLSVPEIQCSATSAAPPPVHVTNEACVGGLNACEFAPTAPIDLDYLFSYCLRTNPQTRHT